MRKLRTEIQLSAPIDQVWQVLTDFDHWQGWNPMVNQVGKSAALHSRLNITISGPGSKDAMQYQPTLLEVNPTWGLRWRATRMCGPMFN